MKIIVSSKYLYNKLKTIDFETDYIRKVVKMDSTTLLILTNNNIAIDLNVFIIESQNSEVIQDSARWQFVCNLMSQVDEQPTILELKDQRLRVSFDY